jgi:hypothetical protein
MRSFLWVAVAALLISYPGASVLKAQMLPPPILQDSSSNPIRPGDLHYSSPYGPRAMPAGSSANNYQFHFGVDYRYGYGTPIYAVEGGTIIKIKRDGANDWVLGIAGNHYFTYIHIFNDGWMSYSGLLPKDHEGNKIWAQACLNSDIYVPVVMFAGLNPVPLSNVSDNSCANKNNLVTLEDSGCFDPQAFAIVFWQDFDQDKASLVLSPCTLYKIGGVQETSSVSAGEYIAIVGNSGEADQGVNPDGVALGAHLHLQANSGDQNPLLFVQHDNGNPPGYSILIFEDKGSDVLTLNSSELELSAGGTPPVLNPGQDSPFIIRTEVNYANAGHDLDAVGISMFSKNSPDPDSGLLCGVNGLADACFDYGGYGPTYRTVFPVPPQPNTDRNETLSAAVQQGVYPQPGRGGVVDFLTETKPLDLTQVAAGPYLILVKTMDVLGDELDQGPVEVEVPPQLTVTVNGNGTVFSTPGGLNSGINNCGAGMTCSDWFDIRNGVTLTAVPASVSDQFLGWEGACTGTSNPLTVFTPSPAPVSINCTAMFTGGGAGITMTGASCTGVLTPHTHETTFPLPNIPSITVVFPPGSYTYYFNFTFSGTMFGPPSTLFELYYAPYEVTQIYLEVPGTTDAFSFTNSPDGRLYYPTYYDYSSNAYFTSCGDWGSCVNPISGTSDPTTWTGKAFVSGISAAPPSGNFNVGAVITWLPPGSALGATSHLSATKNISCQVSVQPATY